MGWGSFFSDPIGTIGEWGQGAIDTVGDLGAGLDRTVRDTLPGGWKTAALLAGGYYAPEGSLSSMFGGSTAAPEVAAGLEAGAGGAGTSTALTGADAAMADVASSQAPQFAGSTISQGSNLVPAASGYDMGPYASPVSQSTNFAAGNADKAALYGAEGYGAAVSPTEMAAYPGTSSGFSLGNMMGSVGDWAAKNPIPAIYATGSLYDMYAKNQMANRQKEMYNQNRADILNTYAPGSPEYNLLKQEMDRKDAAAGRNSQYGTRANEFAGKIAQYRTNALSNMMSGQNALGNQALGNQYGMFNTPLTLAALTATSK
jgi:hypothetical protein